MRTLLLSMALLVSGCFSPKIGEGDFLCGSGNLCPEGFQCSPTGRCFTPANVPDVDLMGRPAFVGGGMLGAQSFTTAGDVLFDTEDGSVKLPDNTILIPAGSAGFSAKVQPLGGPEVAMWEFTNLTIGPGVTVRLTPNSKRGLTLLATDTINIQGNIDLRGFGGFLGLAGENGKTRGNGTTDGGGKGATVAGKGGGGGGYGAKGGAGPNGGAEGGMAYGNAQMSAMHAGAGGGGGAGNKAGIGGNGGGALGLLATTILISGSIDVSGNTPPPPSGATETVGGGGGGSGGSIMMSAAQQLTFEIGNKLRALGGNGGPGANGGEAGGNGAIGRIWTGAGNITKQGTDIQPPPADSDTGALTDFPRLQ